MGGLYIHKASADLTTLGQIPVYPELKTLYPWHMRRVFLALFLSAGLLLLPGCSNSNCENFETTLRNLEAEYLADYNIAKTRVQSSETWVPVIKKGLDMTNYALNDSKCVGDEARAKWQTIHQDLSLKLESWIN